MTSWRERERANDKILADLLPGVAGALCEATGQVWLAEVDARDTGDPRFDRPDFLLHGPGQAKLRLQKGDRAEVLTRVEVVAIYPTKASHYWYRDATRTITVASSRGGEALGREVARRLLPDYLPALAEAHRRIAEDDAANARRLLRRDRIVEVTGGELIGHQQSDTSSEVYLSRVLPRGGHGGIRLWGDGSTGNLELSSVPYPTLLAVASLLARINSQASAGL